MVDVRGDDLLRLEGAQRFHWSARSRGILEFQLFSGRFHAARELALRLIVAALQDAIADSTSPVFLLVDEPDAGRGAALDLVLQARPRPVGEIQVVRNFAGGTVSAAAANSRAPRPPTDRGRNNAPLPCVSRGRNSAAGTHPGLQMQIGKALVIAQHHIENGDGAS